jgi:MarR family transcriptional regulator, organic hydroperoxide resistance regulator
MPPRLPPNSGGALGSVLQFMQLLWAVDHGLQAVSKRMQRTLGVTGPQRLVVRVLGRLPGVSAGEVAAILHVHPSTLTGVLRRLEADGLVTRHADRADRRRTVLHLTAKGRRIDTVQVGTVEAAVRSALVGASRERVAASRLLARIAATLGELAGAPDEADTPPPQPHGRRRASRGRR